MNWPEAFFLTERLEDFEDAMLHGEENAVLGGLFAECLALAKAQATALTATEARIAELEAALTWRPIETAPNEESILILYDDGSVRLIEAEENDLEWRPWQGARGPGVSLPMLWMDATGITSAAVAAIAALNPGDPK